VKTIAGVVFILLACGTLDPAPPQDVCLCKFVAPEYSAIARHAVMQGAVHLRVVVNSAGIVQLTTILDQANRILGESAQNAVRNWKFCQSSGRPQSRTVTVTVSFVLHGSPTEEWAPTAVTFEAPATVTVSTPSGATVQR
jgi:TonB family protein